MNESTHTDTQQCTHDLHKKVVCFTTDIWLQPHRSRALPTASQNRWLRYLTLIRGAVARESEVDRRKDVHLY